jgi:hypothetical protein
MIKKSIKKRPYDKVIIKPSVVKNVIKPPKIENIDNNKKVDYIKPVKSIKNNINKKYDFKNTKPKHKRFRHYKSIGSIEPIFKGETIYLIGGGPSLKGFDFNKLKGKKTIAINKAFLHVPFADVLYWTDTRVYQWYSKQIDAFSGLKVTNKPNPIKSDIINLLNTGKTGLETKNNGLRHGNNSGYAAINLAYHLGASKIILLGYDMGNVKNRTHWHDGYNIPKSKDNLYQTSMLPNFDTLVEPLKKKNVEILNANLNSNITCFKKIDLKSSLNY